MSQIKNPVNWDLLKNTDDEIVIQRKKEKVGNDLENYITNYHLELFIKIRKFDSNLAIIYYSGTLDDKITNWALIGDSISHSTTLKLLKDAFVEMGLDNRIYNTRFEAISTNWRVNKNRKNKTEWNKIYSIVYE